MEPQTDVRYVEVQRKGNGMAVASLVLGIIGIVLSLYLIPSILAIVFGAVGQSRAEVQGGRTMSLWGMWLGITGIGLFVLILASLST